MNKWILKGLLICLIVPAVSCGSVKRREMTVAPDDSSSQAIVKDEEAPTLEDLSGFLYPVHKSRK